MANFASDLFTGTDGTSLGAHTSDGGGGWTEIWDTAGDAVITGNRGRSANNNYSNFWLNETPGAAEYDVTFDGVYFSSNGQFHCAVWGRMAEGNATRHGYVMDWDTSTILVLYKHVNGTQTLLGQYTSVTQANHAFKLEIRDAAKKCFLDGVERVSSTDNDITAAGRVGVRFRGTMSASAGLHMDNLSGDDTTGGAATNIDPAFIAATAQVFDPVVVDADIILPTAIATSVTVFAPTAVEAKIVLPGAIAPTPQVFQPSLDAPVTIDPVFVASAAQVFQPGIGQGIQTAFIASTATVPAPTVVSGVIVQPGRIESTAQVFDPNAGGADIITINALIASSAQMFAPTVSTGGLILLIGRIASAEAVFDPTYQAGVPVEAATILRGVRVVRGEAAARIVDNLPASEGARVLRPTVRIREPS